MDRKEDILNSAETLARTRGFDAFSYADIEGEVGIRKASIHHHFASKADLALALIQRYRERFEQALQKISASKSPAGKQLSAYLRVYREALAGGDQVCLCVAFSAGRETLSDDVICELNGFNTNSLSWLEEVFCIGRKDGTIKTVKDPATESLACLALVEGAQLLARAQQSPATFDAAVAGLRGRIKK